MGLEPSNLCFNSLSDDSGAKWSLGIAPLEQWFPNLLHLRITRRAFKIPDDYITCYKLNQRVWGWEADISEFQRSQVIPMRSKVRNQCLYFNKVTEINGNPSRAFLLYTRIRITWLMPRSHSQTYCFNNSENQDYFSLLLYFFNLQREKPHYLWHTILWGWTVQKVTFPFPELLVQNSFIIHKTSPAALQPLKLLICCISVRVIHRFFLHLGSVYWWAGQRHCTSVTESNI